MNLIETIIVLCIATLLTFVAMPAFWALLSLAARFAI